MRTHALLLAAGLLLASGCTPDGSEPAVTPPAPQTSVAPTSPAPSLSPTTPPQVDPVGVCPDGRYVLTRFSGAGAGVGTTSLSFTGDDLKVTFADGAYVMQAGGRSPYVVTEAGIRGELTFKGTTRGTYSGVGDELTYNMTDAAGTAKFEAAGRSRTFTMTQVAQDLAPSGKAETTCTGDRMTIVMKKTTLELEQA